LVEEANETDIFCKVVTGGILTSHKGINLPTGTIRTASLTEKDRGDLLFGLEHGVDFIALSFVKTAEDIKMVKDIIAAKGKDTPVIAKIEKHEAVDNIDAIMNISDGIMVARGDLGVEIPLEDVPLIQKRLIARANAAGKPVITATQMLRSMVSSPRPTRAEASDVANAIFDGTDAVMLSGETASGKYPLESVEMMDKIALEAEAHMAEWGHSYLPSVGKSQDDSFAIAIVARELAHDREVTCIAVFTHSGRSALLQSKARPQVPILAFTPSEDTYRRLGMNWGVIPNLVPFSNSLEEMIQHVEDALLKSTTLKNGQKVVFISGFPIGAMRSTNLALLHTIGGMKY